MIESMVIAWIVAAAAVGAGAGLAVGLFLKQATSGAKIRAAQEDAERLLEEAKTRQRELILEAKDEAIRIKADAEAEVRERRAEVGRHEKRILQKEENLDRRLEALERRDRQLTAREKEQEEMRAQIEAMKKQQLRELERVSNLTTEEAKALLVKAIEDEARQDASQRLREIEQELKEQAEEKAQGIVALAIQRCASNVVSEVAISVVPLPNDDMKGRIIGREGRNIRALESATGVDVIIDDTPDAVTVSGFDPVRREIARLALQKLILDGRIHPARIEEAVQKAKAEVEQTMKEEGEQAAYKAGVHGLHPELIKLLGRLKYRYSYGQNVLAHSIEVAQVCAIIGAELGIDVNVLRRAGLLHDIGKAVDQEMEGPHALIGSELAKRYGISQRIAHGIAGHHSDEEPALEAVIVGAADAVSGGRPGARMESMERYIKRLEALEAVANSFEGVEKSFAIQAGREIRVLVKPDQVDDLGAMRLSRDIARKIQETLEYPGQIKVTVLRETRAVDYAK